MREKHSGACSGLRLESAPAGIIQSRKCIDIIFGERQRSVAGRVRKGYQSQHEQYVEHSEDELDQGKRNRCLDEVDERQFQLVFVDDGDRNQR